MRLDQKFGFGKYKGLTLKQVYQGANLLDENLIQSFLKYKIEKDGAIMALNEPFIRIDKIEISNSSIKIELYNDDLEGDWSKSIECMFVEHKSIDNFLRGNTTLDEFYTKHYRLNNANSLSCGNPGYVEWLIKKPNGFWFYDKDINELMSLEVYRFAGIKVAYLGNNIYTYIPNIVTGKHIFSKKILELNKKNSYTSDDESKEDIRDYEQQKRDYYSRENDRNYFNTMTDGQLGTYNDFEGSSDNVDDWAGR